MRSNFGRFWNILEKNHKNSQIELIELFFLSFDNTFNNILDNTKELDNLDICKKTLFKLLNKLVKYSDNIDLVMFFSEFYNLDENECKNLIENNYDKKLSFDFKHSLNMFWLGLKNTNKNKLFLIEKK